LKHIGKEQDRRIGRHKGPETGIQTHDERHREVKEYAIRKSNETGTCSRQHQQRERTFKYDD
jgi:hypothetical protein